MPRFYFASFLVSVLCVIDSTTGHPQCLDFQPPFKPGHSFPLCYEYNSFACCDREGEYELLQKYYSLVRRMTPSQQDACENYVRILLCQKCSPYAAHLYGTEDGGHLRDIPALCPGFCQTMISRCPSIVGLISNNIQSTQRVHSGQARAFCDTVVATDTDYCYPNLTSNPLLSDNLGTVKYYQKSGSCLRLCMREVANRLYNPLSAKHANDGTYRLFVSEQKGVVWVYRPDFSRLFPPFLDLSEVVIAKRRSYDERGFLDIAFHPHYRRNGFFYLYYSYSLSGRHHIKISEMKVFDNDMNRANVTTERTLLTIPQPASNHNGGQLLFLDGYLFIFTGDGGGSGDRWGTHGNGQNKKSFLGKVLRIDVNTKGRGRPYGIPNDNPFVNDSNYLPEIYALGVRNMWRCSVDRGDETGKNRGRIICGDVGQDKYEEIDIIKKGANYGWRGYEGYACFDRKMCRRKVIKNYVRPIHVYGHSVGKSVTGGYVYRGCQSPNLKGKYIFGDFMNGKLFALTETESGRWESQQICLAGRSVCKNGGLQSYYGRSILSFGEAENGEVYMLSTTKAVSGHRGGSVYQLVDPSRRGDPTECSPPSPTPIVLSSGTRIIPQRGVQEANVTVRLVNNNGNRHFGRVEIYYDGEWGTICDDNWDMNDGRVICRMLGFSRVAAAYGRARYGEGSGVIWLDEVQCTGQENNIGKCKHEAWGDNNCNHKEDASVFCLH